MIKIEYNLSKGIQIFAFGGSYLPLAVSIYYFKMLSYNSANELADIGKLFIILFFLLCLYNNLIRFFLLTRKLWGKDFLYISCNILYIYDCLRGRYISLKPDSIIGMNYYDVPFGFYPYTIFIIYTNDKEILTCPKFTKEGVEKIYDIIYDFSKGKEID